MARKADPKLSAVILWLRRSHEFDLAAVPGDDLCTNRQAKPCSSYALGCEEGLKDSLLCLFGDSASRVRNVNFIIFRDMTVSRLMLLKALHRAHHDSLTGLPNRSILQEHLKQAFAGLSDRQGIVALLFIDLDGFKDVNDIYGHAAGDHVLRVTAKRMADCTRSSDSVFRVGGDEFVILMPDVSNPAGVDRVAEKLIGSMNPPIAFEEILLRVALSVGMASCDQPKARITSLIEDADLAMYQAKQAGGNRAVWFSAALTTDAQQRDSINGELNTALREKEFELYYQPQVDLQSGMIVGAEALLRWNSPQRGLLLPSTFIPEAEQSGLITEIGEMVFREAVRQQQAWRAADLPSLVMSVNVSPVELHQTSYLANVDPIMLDEAYLTGSLMLELTEAVLLQTDKERGVIHELKTRGLLIGIDDFGVGYCNLDYLRRFPTDIIKIDRSFVANLTASTQDVLLMKAIIAMARSFDLTLIAEGVETKEQSALLLALGCDRAQGFYYSPPVPAARFTQLLRESATTA